MHPLPDERIRSILSRRVGCGNLRRALDSFDSEGTVIRRSAFRGYSEGCTPDLAESALSATGCPGAQWNYPADTDEKRARLRVSPHQSWPGVRTCCPAAVRVGIQVVHPRSPRPASRP